jgi:endonuclease I
MNAEHTWPQSRFTNRYSKDLHKCDMHNLFPSDSEMNSRRSSLRFGNVLEDMEELKCDVSRLGSSEKGEVVFEPPADHKGNVARAIFYFAARYEMKISDEEEATLRDWNEEDPVDEAEVLRAEKIFQLQHTRNPFVDLPDLLEKIENF